MKRLIVLLSIVGMAIGLASCQKAPFITMTGPRSYTFAREGGSQSFSFSANRDWTVSSSESWCSVSPSSGTANEGSITVTISVGENTTYDQRTCTLTIKVEDLTEFISVSQDAGFGLIVSPTKYNISKEEQIINIEVQRNVNYVVHIDDACASWIKSIETKGLTSETVSFSISENKSADSREGKISFMQAGGTLSQVVVIEQAQCDYLYISTTEYEVSREAQNLNIEVQSNVDYEVVPSVDWIRISETKGMNRASHVLNIEENTEPVFREGSVNVKMKGGDLAQTITIRQRPLPRITSSAAKEIGVLSFMMNGVLEVESSSSTRRVMGFLYGVGLNSLESLRTSGTDAVAQRMKDDGSFCYSLYSLKPNTTYYYVAYINIFNGIYPDILYGEVLSFTTSSKRDSDFGEAVDMGLSVKWRSCNIGSSKPEEYGNYYAWGETDTKYDFTGQTYKWITGTHLSDYRFIKYCTSSNYGTVDNLTILTSEDDVASVLLGGKWRMPTSDEWKELCDESNCSWTWTVQDGVNGYIVTSKKTNNSIFLPASGHWQNSNNPVETETLGYYWSSSLVVTNNRSAIGVSFDSSNINKSRPCSRYGAGLTIRPVSE